MRIGPRMLIVTAAALALTGCPPTDADREGAEDSPEAAAEAEPTDAPTARGADAEPTATIGWTAEFAGAEQGTFQGATAVPEEAAGQLTLRLSSEAAGEEPPVTMMVALPALETGQTGELPAENATVLIGATSYFHVPDQPTSFTVRIEEHEEDRLAGSFTGTLRPDGPGDPLQVQGNFEAMGHEGQAPQEAEGRRGAPGGEAAPDTSG